MSTILGRLGQTLPAAMLALALGACSSTSSPTAAGVQATTASAEQQPTSSFVVQGTVVDSASRPLSGIEVECMGDVRCAAFGNQVSAQDGPDLGLKTNAAGAYLIVVTRSGSGERFLMSASGRGYEVAVREVAFPDAACTADLARCSMSVNFALTSREQ